MPGESGAPGVRFPGGDEAVKSYVDDLLGVKEIRRDAEGKFSSGGGGGDAGKPAVWARKGELEGHLKSAGISGSLVAHSQGFELRTDNVTKVKAALEPKGFKVKKFTTTVSGSQRPAYERGYGQPKKINKVLIRSD